jgi:hypothetical protein
MSSYGALLDQNFCLLVILIENLLDVSKKKL